MNRVAVVLFTVFSVLFLIVAGAATTLLLTDWEGEPATATPPPASATPTRAPTQPVTLTPARTPGATPSTLTPSTLTPTRTPRPFATPAPTATPPDGAVGALSVASAGSR